MKAQVVFRPATGDDLRTFAAFDRRFFRLEGPWTLRDYREHFEEPDTCYVVAEERGRIAGFVGAETAGTEMTVMVLLVDPEFRRQGLGRALMGEMLRLAQQSGVERVTLHVRSENTQALDLYRLLGFEVTCELDDFYRRGVDAFEMALPLARQSSDVASDFCVVSRLAGSAISGTHSSLARPTQ